MMSVTTLHSRDQFAIQKDHGFSNVVHVEPVTWTSVLADALQSDAAEHLSVQPEEYSEKGETLPIESENASE